MFRFRVALLDTYTNQPTLFFSPVLPLQHSDWIDNYSGYPDTPRSANLIFHANGDNILGYETVRRAFEAIDAVRNLTDYEAICSQSPYVDRSTGMNTCEIVGVTKFWDHDTATFLASVSNDEEVIQALSASTYPDGTPVSQLDIYGFPESNDDNTLTSVLLFSGGIQLPDLDKESEIEAFEQDILDVLLPGLRTELATNGGNLRFECDTERSFGDEYVVQPSACTM